MASTYVEDNDEGLSYARAHNKTRDRVEKVLSALDHGQALVYSSGSSAVLAALWALRPSRVLIREGYKGTHTVIESYYAQSGLGQLEAAKKKVKLDESLVLEKVTCSSPTL